MKKISLIVATTKNWGIGKKNDLPWSIPEDMKHFKEITTWKWNNVVIMWRKTWDSIPKKFKPLKNRINCVITRNHTLKIKDNVDIFNSLEEAIKFYWQNKNIDEIFLIGWWQLYNHALKNNLINKLYITYIEDINWKEIECDIFIDYIKKQNHLNNFKILQEEEKKQSKNNINNYQFINYMIKKD